MTRHELIGLDERDRWEAAVSDVPHGPGHTWAFSAAMQATSGARTRLYRYDRDGAKVICPLAERDVDGLVDITTPLGFNGFTGATRDPTFPREWTVFARSQSWVCGYIALHPALADAGGFAIEEVHAHNQLYLLDLRGSGDEIIGRLSRNRRRQLRDWPAIRRSLVEDRDALTRFLVDTHDDFLARRESGAAARLGAETLTRLAGMRNALLVGAAGPAGIEAVLLVAYTEHCADALVSVSVPGGERHGAHLNWYAIERLCELQVPVLNMGGGLRPGEDIAEFKRRFGAVPRPLTSIRQIYDHAAYLRLCRERGVSPHAGRAGYFPAYRR